MAKGGGGGGGGSRGGGGGGSRGGGGGYSGGGYKGGGSSSGGSNGGGSSGGGSSGGGIIVVPGSGYHASNGGGSNYNSKSSESTTKILIIVFSCFGGLILILTALCVYHRKRSKRLQNKNDSVTTLEFGSNIAGAPGVYRPTDPDARPSMELPLYTARDATANAPSTTAYPDISSLVTQPPVYSQPANQSDGSSTTAPSPLNSSIFPPMPQSPADTSYLPMPQMSSNSASTSNPNSYPPMSQGPSAPTTNPTPYPLMSQ